MNALKSQVENGHYVQKSGILFLDYAKEWLQIKKGVREKNTQAMYQNIIETHLAFLDGVKLSDIRNSHFQLAINHALDKPRTCQQILQSGKRRMYSSCTTAAYAAGKSWRCPDLILRFNLTVAPCPLLKLYPLPLQWYIPGNNVYKVSKYTAETP